MRGRVVHVLGPHEYDRYVGRANPRHGLKASVLANPYKVGGRDTLPKVLEVYEEDLRVAVAEGSLLRYEVEGSLGKTLACWCCKPRDRVLLPEDPLVCHGQVILRLAWEISGGALVPALSEGEEDPW